MPIKKEVFECRFCHFHHSNEADGIKCESNHVAVNTYEFIYNKTDEYPRKVKIKYANSKTKVYDLEEVG